jgi:hypothetical protein
MANDDLIKSLLDPRGQEAVISKETAELRLVMKERCSELLGLAAKMSSLHLERVAHEAIAGIAALAAQSLAETGFVTRENLQEKGGRFMWAAKRGFDFGTPRGFRRREAKP